MYFINFALSYVLMGFAGYAYGKKEYGWAGIFIATAMANFLIGIVRGSN
jgi:hypothetical protein